MTLPNEEIDAFLTSTNPRQDQRLDLAILFARSMVIELQMRLAEWEAAAVDLENIRPHGLTPTTN